MINRYSATFIDKEDEWKLEKSLIKKRYTSVAIFHIIACISLLFYENDYKRSVLYVVLSPIMFYLGKITPYRIKYTTTSYNSLLLYLYIILSVNFVMCSNVGGGYEFSTRKSNILNAALILVLSWMKYNMYYTSTFFVSTIISLTFNYGIITTIGQLSALLVFLGSSYNINIDERTRVQAEYKSIHHKSNLDNQRSFIAFLLHELRNPLNGVIGIIDIMNKTGWNKDLQDTLKKTSNHIMNILDGSLELSRIEAGENNFIYTPFSMNLLINDAMQQQLSIKPHLKTVIECPENYCVYGDYTKLLQILINLISNAFKFTNEGFVKVIVTKQNENTIIQVEDSGVGISDDKINQVYTKYKTFTDTKGSGLGLYLVHQYVKAMNGTISLQSERNKGSIFTISIPLKIVNKNENKNENENENENENNDESIVDIRKTVIIVDDGELNIMILKLKLESIGANVITFENIEQMLESDQELSIVDLFIFDQHLGSGYMNGTSGIEIMKNKLCNPVIYIASGNCTESDNKMYIEKGAYGCIPKPYPDDLTYLINHFDK